jgi:hypothetical protein
MNIVAKVLPQQALAKLEQLGLSNLLNLHEGGGRGPYQLNNKLCARLVEKAIVHEDSDQIELQVKDGVSMYVVEKIVQHVHDLPIGEEKELPTSQKIKEKTTSGSSKC